MLRLSILFDDISTCRTKARRVPLNGREIPDFVNLGNIIDQALGIPLTRIQDHLISRSAFNNFPVLHDIDSVRNIIGQANIMGDENNR